MRHLIKRLVLFPVQKPKIWSATRGLLAATPVAIYGFIKHKFDGAEPSSHQALAKFFSSPLSIVSLLAAPVILSIFCDIYEWGGSWLRDRQRNYVPALTLTKILASLNNVVGRKLNRFGEVAKRLRCQPEPAGKVFGEITRPDLQIEELVEQIWLVLTAITENPNLKVVLVSVLEGKPFAYAGCSPKSKRPQESLLVANDSFFSYVAKTRSFQVIDDIGDYINKRNKLKKGERSKRFPVRFAEIEGADNSGSICGFALIHSHLNEVVYVLTIKADNAKEISGKSKRLLLPVLEHFFARILLEHSLTIIRNNAN